MTAAVRKPTTGPGMTAVRNSRPLRVFHLRCGLPKNRNGAFWTVGVARWLILDSGRSSEVEHNLAKVGVVGSNPIARSRFRSRNSFKISRSKDFLVFHSRSNLFDFTVGLEFAMARPLDGDRNLRQRVESYYCRYIPRRVQPFREGQTIRLDQRTRILNEEMRRIGCWRRPETLCVVGAIPRPR